MNRWQAMVYEFHHSFNLTIGEAPAVRDPVLRAQLIREEAHETIAALIAGDPVETIDGLCDLIYVALGTAVSMGVDLEPFFDEVHRSNMAKIDGVLNENGKLLKPPGWKPPRIAEILTQQRFDAAIMASAAAEDAAERGATNRNGE